MNETNGSSHRLAVYSIPETKDGEKGFWTKIGVAFTNRDGSINVILDALPIKTNRLQVRELRPPADGHAPAGSHRDFETVEVRP
jgi:hypothetical protein